MLTQHHYFRSAGLIVVFAALFTSQVVQAGGSGAVPVTGQADTRDISTRTVPAMHFFTAKHNMSGGGISQQTQGFATRLGRSLVKAGGERDGPLHILFDIGQETDGQKQELMLAFPSRGNPRSSGRYRAIQSQPFRCSYMTYEGPANGIADSLAGLIKATRAAGYETSGQARYVFSCDGACSAEHTIIELQLGIE